MQSFVLWLVTLSTALKSSRPGPKSSYLGKQNSWKTLGFSKFADLAIKCKLFIICDAMKITIKQNLTRKEPWEQSSAANWAVELPVALHAYLIIL